MSPRKGSTFDQARKPGYRNYFVSPINYLARLLHLFIVYSLKCLYREVGRSEDKEDSVRVVAKTKNNDLLVTACSIIAVIYAVVHAMKMTEYRALPSYFLLFFFLCKSLLLALPLFFIPFLPHLNCYSSRRLYPPLSSPLGS